MGLGQIGLIPVSEIGVAALQTERRLADRQVASLAEEVRGAFDYLPAALAGNVAGMSVIAMLYWGSMPRSVMMWWLTAFGLMLLVRVVLGQRASIIISPSTKS